MIGPSKAVFLSYASEDAETARHIYEALSAAGIEVWFDQSELRGGDAWDAAIRKQIKACAVFIPVISRNTHAREEGYFRLEWKLAIERSHLMAASKTFLLPVVVDDTREDDELIPDRFRDLHWSKLPDGHPTPAFVERVLSLLSPRAETQPAHQHATGDSNVHAAVTSSRQRSKPGWSKLIVLLLGVGLLGAAGVIVQKLRSPMPSAEHPSSAIERSIAVLPFVDLSEKRDQQYLADGVAEEILNLLAGVPGLKVIGRTSSFSFRGKETDVRVIGKSLGAAYILEGSVRRSGDQIRMTTQLLDARDGAHHWSETFEGDTRNIFALQDEIAGRIAHALSLTISTLNTSGSRSVDPEAYDYYVRGNRELEELSEEGFDRALALFNHAFSIDPHFTEAHVGIATAYQYACIEAWKNYRETCESAKKEVEYAISLNPRSADLYATRAQIRTAYDWDWTGAERDIRRAEQLGGGEATEMTAARLAYALGHMDAARRLLDGVLSKDPLQGNAMWDRGFMVEYRSGRFAEGERWIQRSNHLLPNAAFSHYTLGIVLLAQGKHEEALREMMLEHDEPFHTAGLALAYHALGRRDEADKALAEAIKRSGPSDNSTLARVYAFRGDRDHALELLSAAYDKRDSELWYVKGDWLLSNLESDPRYQAFLRKMNLSE
jgi:TolB-like protein